MTAFPEQTLRAAVDESIARNDNLIPVDAALITAARTVADRIDAAIEFEDGQELTKALYLIPHVTNLLREMLATPASRTAAGVTAKDRAAGKLSVMRGGRATG